MGISRKPMTGKHLREVLRGYPLQDLRDIQTWGRSSGQSCWRVHPGSCRELDGGRRVAIPYGKLARVLLLALCTQSVRTCSTQIEIDASFEDLLRELGMSINEENRDQVYEMLHLVISSSFFLLETDPVTKSSTTNHMSLSSASSWRGSDVASPEEPTCEDLEPADSALLALVSRNRGSKGTWIEISSELWEALQTHPIPVDLRKWEAIVTSSPDALPLDVFVWLSYELPDAPASGLTLSWEEIQTNFGMGEYLSSAQIHAAWISALEVVKTVWPEISDRVEVSQEGITLRRGRSAISSKLLKGLPASPADEPSLFDDKEVQS